MNNKSLFLLLLICSANLSADETANVAAPKTVTVSRLKESKGKKPLIKKLKKWRSQAKKKSKDESLSSEQKKRLDQAERIYALMIQSINKPLYPVTVFVARDSDKNLQGVAITSAERRKKHREHTLELIATNPENISDEVNRIPGVGTKLIARIAKEILKDKKSDVKQLGVLAVPSAKGFYDSHDVKLIKITKDIMKNCKKEYPKQYKKLRPLLKEYKGCYVGAYSKEALKKVSKN